jgi:SHS2 domain-containing protein
MLVCTKIQVATIDRTRWRVECVALGEKFVDGVHEQGTEIKAITYSAMQILEAGEGKDGCAEVFVIVDI